MTGTGHTAEKPIRLVVGRQSDVRQWAREHPQYRTLTVLDVLGGLRLSMDNLVVLGSWHYVAMSDERLVRRARDIVTHFGPDAAVALKKLGIRNT